MLILLTVGVLSLALFVIIELELDEPLLDVRVFRYWPYTNSLLLISVLSVGLFGVLFYVPLFLQQAQGMGAFEAGLLLLPQALVMGVLMPVAGRLYDKIGPRWPAVIGLTIVAIGTYELHRATLDMTHEHMMWLLAFRASGHGAGHDADHDRRDLRGAAVRGQQRQRDQQRGAADHGRARPGHPDRRPDHPAGAADVRPVRAAGGVRRRAPAAVGSGAEAGFAGVYAVYQQTSTQVFVSALDELFIITAVLTGVGVVLALMLRSGPVPAAGTGGRPPRRRAAPRRPDTGRRPARSRPTDEPAPVAPRRPTVRTGRQRRVHRPRTARAGTAPATTAAQRAPTATGEPVPASANPSRDSTRRRERRVPDGPGGAGAGPDPTIRASRGQPEFMTHSGYGVPGHHAVRGRRPPARRRCRPVAGACRWWC